MGAHFITEIVQSRRDLRRTVISAEQHHRHITAVGADAIRKSSQMLPEPHCVSVQI